MFFLLKLLTTRSGADIMFYAKLNTSLLRVAEGTGPLKLGNLLMQGAKSCGLTGR